MSDPRSIFLEVAGARHHVVTWGEQDNPALLLVHGLRDHARSWDWIADHFSDRFHVITPDLRGHGDSDWFDAGAYTLSTYVMDLADIVDSLGLNDINLVGHSLGGHISLRYAAAFPDKLHRLCVIEGIELPVIRDQLREPVCYPIRLRRWIDDARERRDRTHRYYLTQGEARQRMAAGHPAIDADTIAHLAHHGTIHVSGKGYRWKYDNACRFRAPEDPNGIDLDDILDSIECPTMLAYGEDSWIPVPPENRLNRLKSRHLVTFANAGHWLHHQVRQPFLESLDDFVSGSAIRFEQGRRLHA